jgi:hypothetical protein
MRKTAALLAASAALAVVSGCASTKPLAAKSLVHRVMLDFQGAAAGLSELPDWVSAYARTGSDLDVQKLPAYGKLYCFVGTAEGPNKDFVQTWARSVSGLEAVATTLSARIEAATNAERHGTTGDADTERNINQSFVNNLSSTFSGLRPTANYWVQWRVYNPDDKKTVRSENYTAYTLFVVEKKSFDSQVATTLQRTVDALKELSVEERQMYSNLIQRILEKGLGVE